MILQFNCSEPVIGADHRQYIPPNVAADAEILWQTSDGVRCRSTRPAAGASVEITITHGDKILTKLAFRSEHNATAFAEAALGETEGLQFRVQLRRRSPSRLNA